METKAQLIAMLRDEFNHWQDTLKGLSEEQITKPKFIEDLSIKDIVAHLTTWQRINVARVEAALQNRDPQYPAWPAAFDSDSEEDLNKINAWIYETHREQAWSDVYQEWSQRFLHLIELGEAVPEKDLLEAGRYSWLNEYPLAAILLGSHEHHQEHLEQILALLN